ASHSAAPSPLPQTLEARSLWRSYYSTAITKRIRRRRSRKSTLRFCTRTCRVSARRSTDSANEVQIGVRVCGGALFAREISRSIGHQIGRAECAVEEKRVAAEVVADFVSEGVLAVADAVAEHTRFAKENALSGIRLRDAASGVARHEDERNRRGTRRRNRRARPSAN